MQYSCLLVIVFCTGVWGDYHLLILLYCWFVISILDIQCLESFINSQFIFSYIIPR